MPPGHEGGAVTTLALSGVILEPGATKCVRVGITPTLLFRAHSNVFGVTATICIQGQDGPGPRQTFKAVGTDYIVVRRGEVLNDDQVFVSFRDPEDLALAEVAKDMLALARLSSLFGARRSWNGG